MAPSVRVVIGGWEPLGDGICLLTADASISTWTSYRRGAGRAFDAGRAEPSSPWMTTWPHAHSRNLGHVRLCQSVATRPRSTGLMRDDPSPRRHKQGPHDGQPNAPWVCTWPRADGRRTTA